MEHPYERNRAYDRKVLKLLRVGLATVVILAVLDLGTRVLVQSLVAARVADELKWKKIPMLTSMGSHSWRNCLDGSSPPRPCKWGR
jgi:hypothetical protein